MIHGHSYPAVCEVAGRWIYVIGGQQNGSVHGFCEAFDTKRRWWKQMNCLNYPRAGASACVVSEGINKPA